jgi:ribosomal protein L40E
MSQQCISCNAFVAPDAEKCGDCKAKNIDERLCKVCRQKMPVGALRCNGCGNYQNRLWRFVLVVVSFAPLLTFLTAIVSVVFYFNEYSSHTHFKVATADNDIIYVKVWNTGRKPSALLGFRLVFDASRDKEARLTLNPVDMQNAINVIEQGAAVPIKLQLAIKRLLPPDDQSRQYVKADLADVIRNPSAQKATLFIDVQESRDDAGEHHTIVDRFSADRISEFIAGRWP